MTNQIATLKCLPEDVSSGEVTLNRWFEVWISTYKRGYVKPTTIDTYISLYDRHIRDDIGNHLLKEFHSIHIQRFYNDFLEKGYSPKYLGTLHTMLNGLFKSAIANELITTNPCSFIKRPIAVSAERRILSPAEQKRFEAKLLNNKFDHIEPLLTTMLGTGLRIGEVLALRWSNVHIAPICEGIYEPGLAKPVSYITVRHTLVRVKNDGINPGYHYILQPPKTKHSLRSIPLQHAVVSALQRQHGLQQDYKSRPNWNPPAGFEDLVFSGKKGQPQWRSTIVSCMDTVIKAINDEEKKLAEATDSRPIYMEKLLPHSLRHTFATRCLEAGIPAKVVQHWLGHASIKMTLDLYTHVSQDLSAMHMYMLEEAMKKI